MLNYRWSAAVVIGPLVILGIASLVPSRGAADGLSVSVQTDTWKVVLAQLSVGSPASDNPDEVIIFELKDKSNPKESVKLGIPQKYLHSVDVGWRGKRLRFTSIEAILPDMRPASVSIGGQGSIQNPSAEQLSDWRNQVSIEWSGGKVGSRYSAQNHYENLIRRRAVASRTDFGLENFRQRVCLGNEPGEKAENVKVDIPGRRCVWQGNDVFTYPPIVRQPWTYYRCTSPSGTFHGICRAYTQVRGWEIEYRFDRRELPRWREFDDAVRRLMESVFAFGEKAKNN